MRVSLSAGEARTIIEASKHMIPCERDAIHQFPEAADRFKQEVKNWRALKAKLRRALADANAEDGRRKL